jgi:hypothetical protein
MVNLFGMKKLNKMMMTMRMMTIKEKRKKMREN